jgi:hypothetical protein
MKIHLARIRGISHFPLRRQRKIILYNSFGERVGAMTISQKTHHRLGTVAQTCNTNYSEGRDQEVCSLRPA